MASMFPRYFTTEELLSNHWAKKPEHRIDLEALFREAGQAREAEEERTTKNMELWAKIIGTNERIPSPLTIKEVRTGNTT